MAVAPRHTPIPSHLENLTAPTRADAERALSNGFTPGPPSRFEDTTIGKRVAAGTNGYNDPDVAREAKQKWETEREAAIADKMATLTRVYQEQLESKQRIEANNLAAFEAEKAELRKVYLAQPGASAADFEKALPGLVEARRQQAVLNTDVEYERMKAAFRSVSGI